MILDDINDKQPSIYNNFLRNQDQDEDGMLFIL